MIVDADGLGIGATCRNGTAEAGCGSELGTSARRWLGARDALTGSEAGEEWRWA